MIRRALGFACLPFLALLLLEIGLQMAQFDFYVPFLYEPLFEKTDHGRIVQTAKSLLDQGPYSYTFIRQEKGFKLKKDPQLVRVVAVGDSSIVGFPEAEYTSCLEQKLKRKVQFINMGFLGCGSGRALRSFEESMELSADLTLLYTGHSEFLDHCNLDIISRYGRIPSPAFLFALSNFKSVKLFWRLLMTFTPDKKTLAEKSRPHFDEKAKAEVYRHMEDNFRKIVATAKSQKKALLMSTLVSNYFLAPEHAQLQTEQVVPGLTDGSTASKKEYMEALRLYSQGRYLEARPLFEQALELAYNPDRGNARTNRLISTVANELQVPLVNLREVLDGHALNGISGNDLFRDNCHLNPKGLKIMAEQFCEASAKILMSTPSFLAKSRSL